MEYIILFYDTSATLVPGGIDIMGKGRGAGFADVRDPILINFQHLAQCSARDREASWSISV